MMKYAVSATLTTEQTSNGKCTHGPEKQQNTTSEHQNAFQCDTVFLQRMLFLMSIVAAAALLTAVASLILALTAMKPQNDATAKVQGFGSTSAMTSEYGDRIERLSENITTLEKMMRERLLQMEKRIQEGLVSNLSKLAGPIGPPGFNGSQGAVGPRGATGPPGPKGPGNFSTCQYTIETGTLIYGMHTTLVAKTESTGKIILGATCSTNFAAEHNLKSQKQASGKWRYVCDCKGTSTLFTPRREETKNCYLHFWECPLTT